MHTQIPHTSCITFVDLFTRRWIDLLIAVFSSETGEVRKVKREKFSIFNFLSAPPQQESTSSEQPQQTLAVAAIEPPPSETTEATSVKIEAIGDDSSVMKEAMRADSVPETKVRCPFKWFAQV